MTLDECSAAVASNEKRPISGAETAMERPDDAPMPSLAYSTPLFGETGAPVEAVNMLSRDMTERKCTENYTELLTAIVESSDDAIIAKDLRGVVAAWNPGAERLFGYAAEEVVGKSITILIPADRVHEELKILERISRGERIDHYETIRRRKDGSLVEISLTISPIRDSRGKIVGASKIARDITDLKRAQERQSLLLKEMDHRVKNAFELASGLVALTARSAKTTQEMAETVRERLNSLSRAHELTLPHFSRGLQEPAVTTTLSALAGTMVSPFVHLESKDDPQVAVDGPNVAIGAGAITGLALVLHEFATNAAKYGALSSPRGRVRIDWSVERGELLLTWRERGGPPLNGEPTRKGFGHVLAHRTITGQLGGRISRTWNREGLVVHVSIPMDILCR